jgi:hypothetical protein
MRLCQGDECSFGNFDITRSNQASLVDAQLPVFFWPEITVLKVLCWKVQYHGTKSSFNYCDKYTAVNIPKLEGRMHGGTNSHWTVSSISKK